MGICRFERRSRRHLQTDGYLVARNTWIETGLYPIGLYETPYYSQAPRKDGKRYVPILQAHIQHRSIETVDSSLQPGGDFRALESRQKIGFRLSSLLSSPNIPAVLEVGPAK